MTAVARYPDSTKTSLEQRLRARARERWPQITSLQIRHRGNFSYVDATLADATTLKLCRLRYVGSAHDWQFAIYRASHDDYDESVFYTGLPIGTCQDALDTACGLYLNDPTAWTRPPTNLRARPLRRSPRKLGRPAAEPRSLRAVPSGFSIPALTPAVTGRDPAVRLNGWPHSGQARARHFGWPQQFPSRGMAATQGRHVLPQAAMSRAQGGPFSLKLSG
jgi:hypothetical protein